LPNERNTVTLTDETDELGLKIPRVTFSYGDDDKRLIRHAMRQMRECLAASGARDLVGPERRYLPLARNCPHE
jgi:hypothetical protein